MGELQRVSDLIHELRVALNAYGDSDASVLIQAREIIFIRANEVHELHERIRDLNRLVPAHGAGGEGEAG